MTEYFYTSELGYADFAVKHGFEDIITLSCKTNKWKNLLYWKEDGKAWCFPRTQHNEAVMDKQEFDVVKYIGKTIAFNKIGIIQADSRLKLFVHHDGFRDYNLDNWTIIERNINGKPYPFPVWDKEGV
jgi:hypothetical protein